MQADAILAGTRAVPPIQSASAGAVSCAGMRAIVGSKLRRTRPFDSRLSKDKNFRHTFRHLWRLLRNHKVLWIGPQSPRLLSAIEFAKLPPLLVDRWCSSRSGALADDGSTDGLSAESIPCPYPRSPLPA